MATVKSVDFYDLCRICTATTEQKIDIFSPEGKTKNLSAKIAECLPLNIEETDRLPKVLCQQCVQHLETYTEFRNICRNSQIMLTSCLNTASAQNGGKVLIKDILSSTGKSLSVVNNVSSSMNSNTSNSNNSTNLTSSPGQLHSIENQSTNSTYTAQLQSQQQRQQQQQPQQQMFTIQGSNVVTQSALNPLTISAAGALQNQDFINSIMQAVSIQNEQMKNDKFNAIPQYTITVDNSTQQQQQTQSNSQPTTPDKEKDVKNNALEEFLKMKPNIKVTPINKKQHNQQQQHQQQELQQPQQIQQQQELQHQQQIQQHQQEQQQQQQLVQFQLQQLLQQQLQQQQLQQQLQLLTSQLQPQQITITTPSLTQQSSLPTAQLIQSASIGTDNNVSHDNSDDLSPSKNKKPKLNFVLTQPTQTSSQTLSATLPQLTTAATTTNSNPQQPPQIQLQFQPTLAPPTLQLQQTQQQNQNAATAALLSNLAPLLRPQTQLNAALQSQTLANVAQNTGTNMLSPNKCYLPITIKDESTDQQFVAHIDAKNFLLPTTYQLQMKLQPQIATADGQPIMQLAPTSIPATLQLAPQALSSNQTFQTASGVATFNNNSVLSTQIIQPQATQQSQSQLMQTQQPQPQVLQQITNTQVQQHQQQNQNQIQPQVQAQPSQVLQLPKNVQITSQQVLTTGNTKLPTTPQTTALNSTSTDEKQLSKAAPTVSRGNANNNKIFKSQKYTISQPPGSNKIEITPTTSFTQQIMQQVQQQQQQKQKNNQQQSSVPTTGTVTTQHGGITVQRITTKVNPATTNSSSTSLPNGSTDTASQSNRQAIITPLSQQQQQQQNTTLSKLPILNKQNITISRITPQNQQQQQTKMQQQQQKTQSIGNTTLKIVQQQIKPQVSTTPIQTTSNQVENQTFLKKSEEQIQQVKQTPQQAQQQPQVISNIPNTTLRISPVKKIIKKLPQKPIESNQANIRTDTTQLTRTSAPTQETIESKVSTTQVHYLADINTILPTANENTAPTVVNNKSSKTSSPSINTSNSSQAKSSLECTQCGRIFKKKEHLTQHVKLHSGVRPFKCNEEGCTKAFHRKEHLLRHLVSHTGKKMFSCDICQKPFSRKDNLSKHRKIHTEPNANYACEFCSKSFAVKTYYEQHKLLHQSKASSEEDKKRTTYESTSKETNQNQKSNNNTTNNNINPQKTSTEMQPIITQHQTQQTQQPQQTQQNQQNQQLQSVQQQLHQLQQQNQTQIQQIMHLQLPTSIVTQDIAGNTITITQSNDPQANGLKTLTLSGNPGNGGNHHDATVLNLPTSLANFVQLSQGQFVNATTGQIMGHLKIDK